MIIIIAPSKTMDFELELSSAQKAIGKTEPLFKSNATELITALKLIKTNKMLASKLRASDAIATRSKLEYETWGSGPIRQAAYTYRGDVFDGVDVDTMSAVQLSHFAKQTRIISGLYGYVRPTDLIERYRLEMRTLLNGRWGSNLYDYWGEQIAQALIAEQPDFIINATSNEYMRSIKKYLPKDLILVEPKFLQIYPDGREKDVTLYTKRARGMMARYLSKYEKPSIEAIVSFDLDGYLYSKQDSTVIRPVFKRKFTPLT